MREGFYFSISKLAPKLNMCIAISWTKTSFKCVSFSAGICEKWPLTIYISTQKSRDRLLRHAVNYDNSHNKNGLSVDSLLPGSTEKPADSPLVSLFNCWPLMIGFSIVFMFQVLALSFARTNIIRGFHFVSSFKKKNPTEAISLRAILCNRNH